MIYTPLINKALKLAYTAHSGQFDTGGIPYIFHPYHLAEQMDNETRTCIALLHDVVEDTDITLDQLSQEFPKQVTDALALLTHDSSVDYYDYVREVCGNLDASLVKLADLFHNMTNDRLLGIDISEAKKKKWQDTYKKALDIILNAITNKTKGIQEYKAEWKLVQKLLDENKINFQDK
ncbi:MAG: GTP pyrophosphokinase [Lachnospiraceae bacterium]|nr:GTP pyrophosphokinase [Lachnospiraceae bacterium]